MSSLNKKKYQSTAISQIIGNSSLTSDNFLGKWYESTNDVVHPTIESYNEINNEIKTDSQPIIVSNDRKMPQGYRLLKNGEITTEEDLCYNLYLDITGEPMPWKSLNRTDLKQTYDVRFWPLVCRKIKTIEITKGLEDYILNKLKSERAFNGDSALKMEGNDFDICEHLSNKGIIKCIDYNRFYL